jgi:O-acetyl-ADP-ribose deacetylase
MVKIWIAEVDITTIEVDVIVCAANAGLVLGCGVAGFIWRRGGQEIQDECDRLGKVKPGEVAVTTGGKLPVRYVFHAVSMGYQHPDVAALLTGVTTRCLAKAAELKLTSIAFPAIAAGRMKLPPDKSCEYMGRAVADFDYTGTSIRSVGFALLDKEAYSIFSSDLPLIINSADDLDLRYESPPVLDMPWRS